MNILIHSKDLTNNTITFDNAIQGNYQLLSFCFTNNIFNVSNTNNKVYFNENGSDLITTLTNGYYDSSDFVSHLQTKMTASAVGTINCSLDNNTRKLTISNDTHNFYLTFATNTTNSARKLLGFDESDGSNASSQTSNNPIDLNKHKCIFINIEENDNKNIDSVSFFNTSLMIESSGSFGETSRYIKNDYNNQYVKFRNVKKLTFKIHDEYNNTINLNSEWILVLGKI
jgi:hypothetical protein